MRRPVIDVFALCTKQDQNFSLSSNCLKGSPKEGLHKAVHSSIGVLYNLPPEEPLTHGSQLGE